MKHFSIFLERKLAAMAAFLATILRISGPDNDIFFCPIFSDDDEEDVFGLSKRLKSLDGVFALLGGLVVDFGASAELFIALAKYSVTVVVGLLLMILVVYPLIFRIFTKMKYKNFFKGIMPAQMLAFSTSSSAATLPVTMERCEDHLGVSEEVSSFVLPLGATINMDGTSLYQAVAAVFIAQAYGMDLDMGQQLTIVLTATLASIGAAAVPGAGMVMLVIVLGSIGVPTEGLALIFGVDRLLDMMRTVVNVTGDATVATVVASTEGQLREVTEEELLS